jgi:4,5-DOPA dioxygenase extradiol
VGLGAKLEALRSEGVLVLGSGNVVHNLGMIEWGLPGRGTDWAMRFDEAARSLMADDPSAISRLGGHPDLSKAVPTPDHFIPLAYLAGLAAQGGTTAQTFIDGYDLGSLSMTSYVVRG